MFRFNKTQLSISQLSDTQIECCHSVFDLILTSNSLIWMKTFFSKSIVQSDNGTREFRRCLDDEMIQQDFNPFSFQCMLHQTAVISLTRIDIINITAITSDKEILAIAQDRTHLSGCVCAQVNSLCLSKLQLRYFILWKLWMLN